MNRLARVAVLFGVCLTVSLVGAETKTTAAATSVPVAEKAVAKKLTAQTMCPVMNQPIDKSLYVDVDGQRIYVCCKMCIAEVKKDPAKWIGKLEEMGQMPEKIAVVKDTTKVIQTSAVTPLESPAPVTDKKAEPKKVSLKPQTSCPVMGEEIDKSLFVDYNGQRIYVCCGRCIGVIKKNPMMYIHKLEKQGQSVEVLTKE